MKLRLKTTFLALAILQLSLAQQINGTWNGKLNVQGQEIPLVFHFVENKKEIKGTMDSPSQGASGIPIEKITFKKNELSLSMMGGSIEYTGELDDHTIEGLFKQSGMEFNLNLTKGEMKKPGNTKLPSTDEELKALAAKEKGKYTYAVDDYFAKPKSSSFLYLNKSPSFIRSFSIALTVFMYFKLLDFIKSYDSMRSNDASRLSEP